jgi:hypothetical protein
MNVEQHKSNTKANVEKYNAQNFLHFTYEEAVKQSVYTGIAKDLKIFPFQSNFMFLFQSNFLSLQVLTADKEYRYYTSCTCAFMIHTQIHVARAHYSGTERHRLSIVFVSFLTYYYILHMTYQLMGLTLSCSCQLCSFITFNIQF